jgi:hypothetical protein
MFLPLLRDIALPVTSRDGTHFQLLLHTPHNAKPSTRRKIPNQLWRYTYQRWMMFQLLSTRKPFRSVTTNCPTNRKELWADENHTTFLYEISRALLHAERHTHLVCEVDVAEDNCVGCTTSSMTSARSSLIGKMYEPYSTPYSYDSKCALFTLQPSTLLSRPQ